MKWDKYKTFVAEHLELGSCLQWHIGPPGGLGNNADALRTWIEQRVRYIAVRPWTTLDFKDPSYNWGWAQREYWVHFHVKNDETHARRLKNTKSLNPTATLSELIENLKQWHGEWWAKQPGDHPLVLDAIVEVRMVMESHERFDGMFDFYLPPQDYVM